MLGLKLNHVSKRGPSKITENPIVAGLKLSDTIMVIHPAVFASTTKLNLPELAISQQPI